MRNVSGHDETHDDLHDDLHLAFGAEVTGMEIGPSPTAAVMKNGGVLRTRRRMTAVSGVAVLAALPVVAVAGMGGGHAPAGLNTTVNADAASTSGRTATAASGNENLKLIPDYTAVLPAAATGESYPPSSADDIKVLA